jgi:riboflavin synthase
VFTGIVETTGEIRSIEENGSLAEIAIEAPVISGEVAIGDSVAVNGACLTVVAADASVVRFDAIAETLAVTSLGDLRVGSRVNLERAVRADGRLDGHIVQGHVDGVGSVREVVEQGHDVRLYVACDREISQYLVPKGSVTIDGVSLTVVGAGEDGFDVALIPLTLEHTTLGEKSPGDRVNLEADVIGKYVKQYLDRIASGR